MLLLRNTQRLARDFLVGQHPSSIRIGEKKLVGRHSAQCCLYAGHITFMVFWPSLIAKASWFMSFRGCGKDTPRMVIQCLIGIAHMRTPSPLQGIVYTTGNLCRLYPEQITSLNEDYIIAMANQNGLGKKMGSPTSRFVCFILHFICCHRWHWNCGYHSFLSPRMWFFLQITWASQILGVELNTI